ncbi:hypothetical protein FH972_018631 [Carpinus fangiana]|uniref:NmrA-like domain-containing protein n=1 Tax=Carpinus fangiana TaxID=176857 RepID=A0A5N6RMX7_9ROSI|nr:hypothetical protein FH972_018631 [Carpinus fangiana]
MTVSASVSTAKGRVLIVGATGFIGQFVAEASLGAGRPTYVLVRPGPVGGCPSKGSTIRALQDKGATILHGLINDKEFMEKILKEHEIDIVISAVGGGNILDQLTLIEAIKTVGTIKRFLPSEFGHDVDRADPVEPGLNMYKDKRRIRRLLEEYGVPHTYICCNSIASWPYYDNTHPSEVVPPLDQFQIYGDGSVKAYFVAGTDIGKFTIKTIDDIRALNKNVHFRPASNLYNINELASLWERKIGRTLPRVTVSENDLLAAAAGRSHFFYKHKYKQRIAFLRALLHHSPMIFSLRVVKLISQSMALKILKWELSTLTKLFEPWMSASMTFFSKWTTSNL